MSPLRAALADYLVMRHALGYKLERQAKVLDEFVTYLEGRHFDYVTADVALDWSTWSGGPRAEAAKRLSAIRLFARYLAAFDERTEVPSGRLLPHRVERKAPIGGNLLWTGVRCPQSATAAPAHVASVLRSANPLVEPHLHVCGARRHPWM
jgi:hypothetical protein